MIKILFVCHGNICRSPMAEYLFRDLIRQRGLSNQFHIASAATSTEEIGNPIHYGTRRKLLEHGISPEEIAVKQARQMTRRDYEDYDYLIAMDQMNVRNMLRIVKADPQDKIHLLLDYTDRSGSSIADPWYTGNFEDTYRDVCEGCEGLLAHILRRN